MATRVSCTSGQCPITSQQDVKKELEQLFKTADKTHKLVVIDGIKIAIIFNPNGKQIVMGGVGSKNHVIIVSEQGLPEATAQKIKEAIPSKYRRSFLGMSKVDNVSIFQYLGLE